MLIQKRIGLMVPATNTVMEEEYHRASPPGVSIHTSRFMLDSMSPEGLAEMRKNLAGCAAMLKHCADLVVLGILSGTIESEEMHERIEQEIQTCYQEKVITIAHALLYAIKNLQPKNTRLITPYDSAIAKSQASFFKRNGVDIKDVRTLGYNSSIEASKITSEKLEEILLHSHKGYDLTLFTCTNVHTFETIKRIYKKHQLLVISSNLATLWQSLDTLGVAFNIYDFLLSDK